MPVDTQYLTLSKLVLTDVAAVFNRHLNAPSSPLTEDPTGIGEQLIRWRARTVRDVLDILADIAGEVTVDVSAVLATGVSVPDAPNVIVAADPLVPNRPVLPLDVSASDWRAGNRYRFDPID